MKDIISHLKIVEAVHGELPDYQKNRVIEFISLLYESATLIYRGESFPEKHYAVGADNIIDLAYRVFLVGPKGEHFWKNKSKFITNRCSDKTFKILIKSYQKVFHTEKIHSVGLQSQIVSFIENNAQLVEFFTTMSCDKFKEMLSIVPSKEKKQIIEYYISIMHTIGHYALQNSYFISTSSNMSIAKEFNKNGIIYVGWLNNKNKDIFVKNDIDKTLLDKYGFPYCDRSIFPEQSEECLKYGILPHFLVGFIYNDTFYVNHHLVCDMEKRSLIEIVSGIDIDQSKFETTLKLTSYKRSYYLNYDQLYIGDYK